MNGKRAKRIRKAVREHCVAEAQSHYEAEIVGRNKNTRMSAQLRPTTRVIRLGDCQRAVYQKAKDAL